MQNILVFCLILTFTLLSCTPKVEDVIKKEKPTEIINSTESFPDAWLGNWLGSLDIYNASGKSQTIPMELVIAEIDNSDNYVWAIIYGEDKEKGRRAYELKIVDPSKGLYIIDEKNSIELEAYLLGNKLFSRFSVAESLLLCTYEKVGERLIFEVNSGAMKEVSTTGGQEVDGEEIPEVKAYPINVLQRGELRRRRN